MGSIKLNSILLIPIVLFFFPSFVFWISFLNAGYLYFFIFLYIALCIIFVLRPKRTFLKLINLYKKTPFKYLVIFMLLIIFNLYLTVALGLCPLSRAIRATIMQFGLFIFPILIYFIAIIDNYISYKNFMKIFIFLYWCMLILGFIAYIGQLFDITLINNIFDFFANSRLITLEKIGRNGTGSNYEAFGLPRLDNLFVEPSFYAIFLFLFLPFTYSFSHLKEKLYTNIILDKIIKHTLVPFNWLNIILTFSPIFLCLSLLITFIYYFKSIVINIKKVLVPFLVCFIFIFFLLASIDLSNTYLSRIINLFNDVHSFDDFIDVEPSLATRIVTYINLVCIWLKHPFIGVGFSNTVNYILQQFQLSPVSLTPELIYKYNFYTISHIPFPHNASFMYDLMAENGIFITGFFIFFFYKMFSQINMLVKLLSVHKGTFDYQMAQFLKYSLIAWFIKAFYDSNFMDMYTFFLFVLVFMFIYRYTRLISRKEYLND